MKKTCLLSLALSLVVVLPSALHAQATAAATRGGIAQVGVAYTVSNEDQYIGDYLQGMTFYGTFDLNNHIGVEGNAHLVSLFKSYFDFKESSYDAGIRWAQHYRKFTPYGKGLDRSWPCHGPQPRSDRGPQHAGNLLPVCSWRWARLQPQQQAQRSARTSNISAGRTSRLTVSRLLCSLSAWRTGSVNSPFRPNIPMP